MSRRQQFVTPTLESQKLLLPVQLKQEAKATPDLQFVDYLFEHSYVRADLKWSQFYTPSVPKKTNSGFRAQRLTVRLI
jgi:hypothetical protein